METITIIKATVNDVDRLQKLAKQTFVEAFASSIDEENMSIYLERSFSVTKLTSELSNPMSQFYFASLNDEVIGYLKLNTGNAQTELVDLNALEIERIYVLAQYQSKKVGQLLFEKAIEIAKQITASYIWLGVWEENLRAISFYKRNGFEVFDKHDFKFGEEVQTDLMMKRSR